MSVRFSCPEVTLGAPALTVLSNLAGTGVLRAVLPPELRVATRTTLSHPSEFPIDLPHPSVSRTL